MIRPLVFLLCVCSSAYAESGFLAPVIDNSIYPKDAPSVAKTPSNNAMYEIFGQLEQMQFEIQQLRGVVENQAQIIDNLDQRQNNIYSDLDERLQALGGNTIRKSVAQQAPIEQPAVSAGDYVVNNAAVNPISQAQQGITDISVPGAAISASAPQADEFGQIAPPNPIQHVPTLSEDMPVPSPAITPSQAELYQTAYATMTNGQTDKAITQFKKLLRDHPEGKFASNSQYWLGEGYKLTRQTKAAKQAFSRVVNRYARSRKVPDALLKLGYMELDEGNITSARKYLYKITEQYPHTTAAHLANNKLLQMGSH
ncbi:MAG: tol-pal system protein YbgF [Methylococcales bacterium]|nr:tol-pal system protein YbgF [Methylococcales bacterium]